ncbi:RICIN domain-containing protein [Saccharothrix sp. NRRL B-16314]|uniref:RICIN domain-containing protein n=1 Tax=Saccharothrix sp. NRRL B-16314 TaxID=1463825 RepID=UPI001E48888A|nr:RICIN domain-containing protein [Saccharothrix sp. NRRL B-16314]
MKLTATLTGLALVAGTVLAAPPAAAATVDTTATYVLVSRHSGKAVQVGSTSDGAAVTQGTRTDSAGQQWQFVDSGGGYYRLKSRLSGKVVDIAASSTANGANVVQWTDKNTANQQFRLADSDGGHVRFVNRNSGKALDVWERSTADGARISQYDDTGATNQQWQLVRLGSAAVGVPTDPNIRYFGRWNYGNPAAYVSEWAGAYVVVGFTGRTVKLRQRNAIDFYVSIDGGPDVSYVNRSGTVDLTPTPLASGNHTLRVSYRPIAGSYRGDAVFQGVELDAGATTFAPAVPSRVVEFVGDSITVGQQSSKQALTAYGWLVGERLGTGHTQIAVGGACLVSAADGCIGMSDRFLRTGLQADATNWDFSRYRADVVVINLGTNDVGHSVTGAQFQSAYVTLLRRAREKYPTATVLAMQTFRKRYIPETQAAVQAVNDPKIRFVDTTGWIVESTDTTDNVHPNDQGHRKIADRLAPIVSAALG